MPFAYAIQVTKKTNAKSIEPYSGELTNVFFNVFLILSAIFALASLFKCLDESNDNSSDSTKPNFESRRRETMASEDVVLLDFWVSPFCQRAKVALAEKGVAYEKKDEDIFGGKSDQLVSSNPIYQKVPVLLHDGKPVCESTNIVHYIDEAWPAHPLMPSSAYGKSRARFWADYIDKKLFDSGKAIWTASDDVAAEAAKKEFLEVLKCLEGALLGKDYFGGDSFGFVDVIAIPMTSWFLTYEKFGDFKVEQESPKISAWIKRCLEKESVAKSVTEPEKVYEFVVNMRKMLGMA